MTEVLLACTLCDAEIAVDMNRAVLRTNVDPHAEAELLFCCPSCNGPGRRRIVGDLLTLLLLDGVVPLRLSEPTLPDEDRAPPMPLVTRDDLLSWHEQLLHVHFVTPWER